MRSKRKVTSARARLYRAEYAAAKAEAEATALELRRRLRFRAPLAEVAEAARRAHIAAARLYAAAASILSPP